MNDITNITENTKKGNMSMKNIIKIISVMFLLLFFAGPCMAQQATPAGDTLRTAVKKQTQEQESTQKQKMEQKQYRNQGSARGQGAGQNGSAAGTVKKVNSAKPDWSKARGARPNIVRPSGSGVPMGAGKPGGAGAPGRGR